MAYAAGQIHRNGCKNTHTLTPLFGIGVQAILLLALRCLFSFSTAVTKTGFAFLWRTGENEYRQKAFQSHTRKCGCRYPGGFQRRAGEACLWHTILLARSSVLYLLLRPNKAIRSCGRACAVTSTDDLVPPFPNETRFAGLSFGEGVGSECGMKCSTPRQSSIRPSAVSRAAGAPAPTRENGASAQNGGENTIFWIDQELQSCYNDL